MADYTPGNDFFSDKVRGTTLAHIFLKLTNAIHSTEQIFMKFKGHADTFRNTMKRIIAASSENEKRCIAIDAMTTMQAALLKFSLHNCKALYLNRAKTVIGTGTNDVGDDEKIMDFLGINNNNGMLTIRPNHTLPLVLQDNEAVEAAPIIEVSDDDNIADDATPNDDEPSKLPGENEHPPEKPKSPVIDTETNKDDSEHENEGDETTREETEVHTEDKKEELLEEGEIPEEIVA